MSRIARQYSESGIYHIVFRGVNKQHIFEEDEDYQKMLDILVVLKNFHNFEIYAYCLMSNHVHILIKEQNFGEISLIMKRLLTKYARYYNNKYNRSGALIGSRYKSLPVEIDDYFLRLFRYIHQNPLRANMAKTLKEYSWSSYNQYVNGARGIADKYFILGMIDVENILAYLDVFETEVFWVNGKQKMSDESVRRAIILQFKIEPNELCSYEILLRNEILSQLIQQFPARQIERITGISRSILLKIAKKGTSPLASDS